jgi:arylformamidase
MKTTSAVYAAFALVCAFASVRTSAAGTDLPVGTLVESDVAYGDDALQKFDVYYGAAFRGAPVILMVHGGGWARGDKTNAKVVTNKVAHCVPAGYVFISVNYRLLPEADPVQQAVDVAHALAFAQRNAARWGGDPTRFVLMGHSAGAHLVALLASDPTIAARAAAVPWRGTGVFGQCSFQCRADDASSARALV